MDEDTLKHARVLIVDDQDANLRLLERILTQAGYTGVRGTTDPRKAAPLFADYRPDLILLDLHMPHLDGFAIMDQLRPLTAGGAYLPILILTADITQEARQRALSMGAKDFLTKPFDQTEVLLRIRNLLETRLLHLQLQDQNLLLEHKVRERTQELEDARIEILERLARAAEYRDDLTGKHTQRVGEMAARLAAALGLPESEVEFIRRAAPLHDVGKIGISDTILLKPGKLTAKEFEVMKTHTTIGATILSGSRFPLMQKAEAIALIHHERWDGAGYPHGLKGDAIPIEGRIVAVADAYDAMTSDRPYRKALSPEEAREILWGGGGSQWDEDVVEAFASLTVVQKGVRDGGKDAPGAVRRRPLASRSGR
ncbi:MAG: response regulator [Armatimonadetes bacterium]|nr:response regulator [Armatimonadota bacterium]